MSSVILITNSGVGLYCFRREFVDELINKGHKVTLAYSENDFRDEFIRLGASCISLPFDSASTNPLKDTKLFIELLKLLRRVKPDVAVLYTIKPCIYAGIACRILKIPYIASVTGISPAIISSNTVVRTISRVLSRMGYKKARVTIFQNTYNEQLFTELKIAPGKHLLTNGSGVNLDKFKELEYPPDDGNNVKFLYLGRVNRIKGIDEMCAAISKLKAIYDNVECTVVGEIGKDSLPEFEKAKASNCVTYHKQVNDVTEYLNWCNALIMPSYGEGMSNVMQEASASGRPVIASDIPGCKEIFDEGVSGLAFQPQNAESTFETLKVFCNMSYAEKKKMGQEARIKIEREFDKKQVVNTYMSEVENIVREVSR